MGQLTPKGADQRLALAHQIKIIPSLVIPLEHGEFRLMQPPVLLLAETMANLKYAGAPPGEKPFHAQFRRSVQITTFAGERNQIGFGNQDRQPQGGIDFNVVAFEKKRTDSLQQV